MKIEIMFNLSMIREKEEKRGFDKVTYESKVLPNQKEKLLNIYHKDVSFNELFGVKSSFIDKEGIKINPGDIKFYKIEDNYKKNSDFILEYTIDYFDTKVVLSEPNEIKDFMRMVCHRSFGLFTDNWQGCRRIHITGISDNGKKKVEVGDGNYKHNSKSMYASIIKLAKLADFDIKEYHKQLELLNQGEIKRIPLFLNQESN